MRSKNCSITSSTRWAVYGLLLISLAVSGCCGHWVYVETSPSVSNCGETVKSDVGDDCSHCDHAGRHACAPAGDACTSCWQPCDHCLTLPSWLSGNGAEAGETAVVPPHSRFHPVPTRPVFAPRTEFIASLPTDASPVEPSRMPPAPTPTAENPSAESILLIR